MQIKKKSSLSSRVEIKNISLSKKLREENKSNDLFEVMISNLTLEELIALKLEMTYKNMDSPMYGFKILRVLYYLVQDAVFKFAVSITPTKYKARLFLGLDGKEFNKFLKKYEVMEYLIPEEKKENADH